MGSSSNDASFVSNESSEARMGMVRKAVVEKQPIADIARLASGASDWELDFRLAFQTLSALSGGEASICAQMTWPEILKAKEVLTRIAAVKAAEHVSAVITFVQGRFERAPSNRDLKRVSSEPAMPRPEAGGNLSAEIEEALRALAAKCPA